MLFEFVFEQIRDEEVGHRKDFRLTPPLPTNAQDCECILVRTTIITPNFTTVNIEIKFVSTLQSAI